MSLPLPLFLVGNGYVVEHTIQQMSLYLCNMKSISHNNLVVLPVEAGKLLIAADGGTYFYSQ